MTLLSYIFMLLLFTKVNYSYENYDLWFNLLDRKIISFNVSCPKQTMKRKHFY